MSRSRLQTFIISTVDIQKTYHLTAKICVIPHQPMVIIYCKQYPVATALAILLVRYNENSLRNRQNLAQPMKWLIMRCATQKKQINGNTKAQGGGEY